ncbi:MAG: trigger factor [bacterium]|nr:trigger factor [bacterium]
MESTLAPAGDGKVRISISLDSREMDAAEDAAYRRIVRHVRLPGFRPGKAPRKVLEARLGSGSIRTEAMQDALGYYYRQAVLRHDVDVIAPPEIDVTAGQEEGPVTFEALVEVRPSVSVDGYDTLEVEITSPLATDDDVDRAVDNLRAQFSELETVGRPAIDTDHVTINVTGTQNGVEVEGLTVSDFTYEVGSGAVVPEMDENLRGASTGDILEFNARHPDPSIEDLLRIRILVKEVQARILPDLDDDLVRSVSEFETVSELRDDLAERLGEEKRARARTLLRERVSEAVAGLVVSDLPEALVASEADRRLEQLQKALAGYKADLEGYLAARGVPEEQFRSDLRRDAEASVRLDLGLRAVADAEALEVTDADLAAEADRVAALMELDPEEFRRKMDESGGWSPMRAGLRKELALQWLAENAALRDPDGASIAGELLTAPDTEGLAALASSEPDGAVTLDLFDGGHGGDLDEEDADGGELDGSGAGDDPSARPAADSGPDTGLAAGAGDGPGAGDPRNVPQGEDRAVSSTDGDAPEDARRSWLRRRAVRR